MKRTLITLSLFTVMLGATVVSSHAAPPALSSATGTSAPAIKWHSDLKAAHKQAVAEDKPILVVFGAEWCGYCKKLERQTINTPEMSRYINENFVPVHLDLDKEKRVGEILEVTALPCTVILSPNADLLGRINGYHTPAPYQKNLVAARALYRPGQAVVPTEGVAR